MSRNDEMAYRYFTLAFVAAFLVLAIMFLFMVLVVHPAPSPSLTRQDDVQDAPEAYAPLREDCLTVLFMGTAEKASAPHTYVLARFDPIRETVPIVVLPAATVVDNNGKPETLSEIYKNGGASYTKDRLAKAMGIDIDRYVRMNSEEFVKCANAIGSVEFDLPFDMEVEENGAMITLMQGTQLLDGHRTATVLGYSGSAGGEEERMLLVGQMTVEIVNQRMDIALSAIVDRVFEIIVNIVDTDISYADYAVRKNAAAAMADAGRQPALFLSATGTWREDGTFEMADTFLARVAQSFG